MAPLIYSVDVHVRANRLDDQTLLVVVDWSAEYAEATRRQLNAQLWAAALANRALGSDLREYSLRAYRVDERGERNNPVPAWAWRYQPFASEIENDGWWQL